MGGIMVRFISFIAGLILTSANMGLAQTPVTTPYTLGATERGMAQLPLDIYPARPFCNTPRPTVIYVHGGGFQVGSRRNGAYLASKFQSAGINFLSIDYRKASDQPVLAGAFAKIANVGKAQERFPGQAIAASAAFQDTLAALNFTLKNADPACVDPNKIVLMGHSAGAVAVLHVAYALDEYGITVPRVAGVIDMAGTLTENVIKPGDPPLMILHGENDVTVPFTAAQAIWAQAQTAGLPVAFHSLRGTGHDLEMLTPRNGSAPIALAVEFVKNATNGQGIRPVRAQH